VREKGVKYFKCNQYGHVAAKCTAKEGDVRDVKKYSVAQADRSLIKHYLKTIEINNHKTVALMDTGSIFNRMRKDYYNKITSSLTNKTIHLRVLAKE